MYPPLATTEPAPFFPSHTQVLSPLLPPVPPLAKVSSRTTSPERVKIRSRTVALSASTQARVVPSPGGWKGFG